MGLKAAVVDGCEPPVGFKFRVKAGVVVVVVGGLFPLPFKFRTGVVLVVYGAVGLN